MKEKEFVTPSKNVPIGGRRACLCENEDTYSIECCNGKLINQGIGPISRNG
jgi:hypothetical protein